MRNSLDLICLAFGAIWPSSIAFTGPLPESRMIRKTFLHREHLIQSHMTEATGDHNPMDPKAQADALLSAGRIRSDIKMNRRDFANVFSIIALGGALTTLPEESKASDIQLNNNYSQSFKDSSLITSTTTSNTIDTKEIFDKATKKALSGGKAGASAAVVQVLSLMWLRTAMNYQYRYGGTLPSALQTLTAQGGIPRLYQGLPFALVQGPLTRFGDTAANVGILALLDSTAATAGLPLPVRTGLGSLAAGAWRIVCMPIDTSKTVMQVEGSEGLARLKDRILDEKSLSPLYQGALASAAATAVGHFPWFLTFNFLNDALPQVNPSEDLLLSLARSALLGVFASSVSDISSNSLRVIKTTKQTMSTNVDDGTEKTTNANKRKELSYIEIVNKIIEEDGIQGLFGRGLRTRLYANAIQGAAFSVLWKYFQALNDATAA